MFKKIKNYLCKEELLDITKEKLFIELIKQTNMETQNDLDNERKRLKEERKFFEESYKKRFNEDLIKEIKLEKKKLKDIIDYNLMPGNKIWVLSAVSNEPVEIIIEGILIKKDGISINSNIFHKEGLYFKTKKEAIKEYNNILEKQKIK